MEILFWFIPWVVCSVLLFRLNKEKQRRVSATDAIQKAMHDADAKIAQIKADSQAALLEMRQRSEQRIQEERDAILSNKEVLRSLSDKDLLIECMSALDTYAQRLNRLENRMTNIQLSLDNVIKVEKKEKQPYLHNECITNNDLIDIAQEAAKRMPRITNLAVSDAVVRGKVLSIQKISTWSFSIDFNDNGQLTGRYTVYSENDDSTVPQQLAKDISKEILYRLNCSPE